MNAGKKSLGMSRPCSFPLNQDFTSKLDLEAFHQWVVAFCTIRFDLEQGQLIEESYPPGCLTHDEELEISFNSFPDSVSQHHNRSSIHDCIFFFRVPRRHGSKLGNVSSSEIPQNTEHLAEVQVHDSSPSFNNNQVHATSKSISAGNTSKYMYGYVFNRQRHDERLKRGGEQKSVVILSPLPYSSVFRPLLQIMGPLYFDIGSKALENIAAFVTQWCRPMPGKHMELPIGNAVLQVNLPPSHSLPPEKGILLEESTSSMAPFLPTNQSVPQGLFHDSDLFGTFRGLLIQLWLLWELLIIGEPILIIAPTPPQCCEAVAGLVSLVAPLLPSVDFRPYFTIHDPEFAILNSIQDRSSFPPMILGVTNLFFLKALHNFPHVVSVGSPASNRLPFSTRSTGRNPTRPEGFGLQQLSLRRFSPTNFLNSVKLRKDGPLCLMTEHKEAIWSTYAATTKPDTSILNRLIDAGISPRVEESMSVVNNEILRRHFLELTTNFLAPFGPYLKAITPSEGSSPFVDPPPLPAFKDDEFLKTLSERGPGKFLSKRMRSNWLELYRGFLRGHNFMPWFQRRRAVAEQEQQRLWRQARLKTNIQFVMAKLSELEIVDCFNDIEKHLTAELQLVQSGKCKEDSISLCQKLKHDMRTLFSELPEDVQQLLLLNPEKAAVIKGSNVLVEEDLSDPIIQAGSSVR
uniref:UDENN domain-containing protein n=1 Tax=Kalanchoe fedtschenkoi TaxID=63787 RepID=A0A7N0TKL6_KALFE